MAFPLQEQYVNLLTGFGFRRIFGSDSNKQLLVDFLNTLLPEHAPIQSLSHTNAASLGSTPVNRSAIFDIDCQGVNGERFIVELQMAKQNFFKNRSAFYASFPIQALRGEGNCQLTPVYAIGILDFVFNDHRKAPDFIYTLELNDQHGDAFYDQLTLIYVALPKFTKPLEALTSQQDKWLYLFKHLPEIEGQPYPFQDAIFSQLFEVAKIANFTQLEQDSYQDSLKHYRDLNNVINTAKQEGFERGVEQIIERGRKAEKLEIARSLLSQLPIEAISQATGLTVAEITQLRRDAEQA